MTKASDCMRLRLAWSAQSSSSASTLSSRISSAWSFAASGERFVSHATGNTTRASAYWPAFTFGTVYVTLPSALMASDPSSGPWPHARTFSPGSTATPCGTGSASVMVTSADDSSHWSPTYFQFTSATSL